MTMERLKKPVKIPEWMKGMKGRLGKPATIPKWIRGGAGLLGRAATSVPGAFVGGYFGGRAIQKALTSPESTLQPYLQGGWMGFQPDPELFYKQAGGIQLGERGKGGFAEKLKGLSVTERQMLMEQEYATRRVGREEAERKKAEGKQIPPPNNVSEWYDREGTRWVWNGIDKYVQSGFDPEKIYQSPEALTKYQQGELDLRRQQMEQQRLQDEALMGWYQQQAAMQQQEQERQYYSSLLANPMSWLQAEAYRGTTPVVQEWMKPLMSGQYQTGQQIPGWMGRQGEGQAMGSLPELRTPSAQLWARMGPTAQAQYMGYGQARTGIRPEETMFRLGALAPPSGRFGGLRRMR